MDKTFPMSSTFLAALPAEVRGTRVAARELEDQLAKLLDAARARWDGLAVPEGVFLSHLASKVESPREMEDAIRRLHATDLYLVVGCIHGLEPAFKAFEKHFFPDVDAIVRRSRKGGVEADDLRQVLREKLFLQNEGGRRRLASYSAQGELRGWFRVIVTRTLLSARRSSRVESSGDDELLRLPAASGSELDHIRTYYANELRAAFPAALASLSVDQRRLLRQRYLDGLTHDEMAALNRIHRATVKRHLASAHQALTSALRELLKKQLGITTAEFESILRAVRSQFHITLRRVFLTQ
jgi:RNA polymerase sigma-70 factor, ECF subfamily